DKRIVLDCVKEHGIDEAVLALYRIFFAFLFLSTDRDVVLRWCIETLQWACGQASLVSGRSCRTNLVACRGSTTVASLTLCGIAQRATDIAPRRKTLHLGAAARRLSH